MPKYDKNSSSVCVKKNYFNCLEDNIWRLFAYSTKHLVYSLKKFYFYAMNSLFIFNWLEFEVWFLCVVLLSIYLFTYLYLPIYLCDIYLSIYFCVWFSVLRCVCKALFSLKIWLTVCGSNAPLVCVMSLSFLFAKNSLCIRLFLCVLSQVSSWNIIYPNKPDDLIHNFWNPKDSFSFLLKGKVFLTESLTKCVM